ncbi:hypothetical protein OpiT1DRAFT_04236 [Opitutaceae bacterium TAV1]|nr:hypothetical protein OpiT1DRAFT_04236 [Opitutaceae bacterium TAV1]
MINIRINPVRLRRLSGYGGPCSGQPVKVASNMKMTTKNRGSYLAWLHIAAVAAISWGTFASTGLAATYFVNETITDPLTSPTRFLGGHGTANDIIYPGFTNNAGASINLAGGANIGTSTFPSSGGGWAMNSLIALGGNDGIYGANPATYGSLNLEARGNALSLYGTGAGNLTGIYLKTLSAGGAGVSVDLATTVKSVIDLKNTGTNSNGWFAAILAENRDTSSGSTLSVNLSNIDIRTESQSTGAPSAGRAAVYMEATGQAATTFNAASSATIETFGAWNQGVHVGSSPESGSSATISNAGRITTHGDNSDGIWVFRQGSGSNTQITNTGSITVSGENSRAIHVEFAAGITEITNAGTIESTGVGGYAIYVKTNTIDQRLKVTLLDGSQITGDVYLGTAADAKNRELAIGATTQVIDGKVTLAGTSAWFSLAINDATDFGQLATQGIDITDANLNVTLGAGFSFDEATDKYVAFDIITGSVTGEFANAVNGGIYSVGIYNFNVSYDDGVKLWLGAAPVPESAAYAALAGLALLVFAALRRRRRP